MKGIVQTEKYGEIVVEESIWTGRKKIYVAGKELPKVDKKRYMLDDNTYIDLTGNSITGVNLHIDGVVYPAIKPAKWYEIALSVILFVFFIVWGNSVTLCSIVPLVGGAIGGAVTGLFVALNLVAMKEIKNVALKLVVFVAFFALTFGVLAGLAFLILQA